MNKQVRAEIRHCENTGTLQLPKSNGLAASTYDQAMNKGNMGPLMRKPCNGKSSLCSRPISSGEACPVRQAKESGQKLVGSFMAAIRAPAFFRYSAASQ